MMSRSEDIKELALALGNFQGELHDVYKSSKGYGYDYADLSAVFESIRPLMKKHGLSVMQPVGGANNMIELSTIIMHSSGQHMSSTVSIAVDLSNKKMNSLQAAGSTITYMRRYCLCSILGIATTDDDGKSGGEAIDNRERILTAPRKDVSPPPVKNIAQAAEKAQQYISEEHLNDLRQKLMQMIIHHNVSREIVDASLKKANVQSINEFNFEQITKFVAYIENTSSK